MWNQTVKGGKGPLPVPWFKAQLDKWWVRKVDTWHHQPRLSVIPSMQAAHILPSHFWQWEQWTEQICYFKSLTSLWSQTGHTFRPYTKNLTELEPVSVVWASVCKWHYVRVFFSNAVSLPGATQQVSGDQLFACSHKQKCSLMQHILIYIFNIWLKRRIPIFRFYCGQANLSLGKDGLSKIYKRTKSKRFTQKRVTCHIG